MDVEPRLDRATQAFVLHRSLLFTVAYEMLGSAADAEDVVQETWLRWVDVPIDTVRDPRAFLVRIVARQALNRLRTLARRRETYTGPWLPEPLLTAPDVADDVEFAESLSMAMLLVLETLSPVERAVFVLRDVFDVDYDEIAQAIEKSPTTVRQIAHRARKHVAERRRRQAPSQRETRAAVESFRHAVETGELQEFLDILAPDVVMVADGGGNVLALSYPVSGSEKVANLIAVSWNKVGAQIALSPVPVNGSPALVMTLGGELHSVVSLQLEHGLVTGIHIVRNPEKLSRVRRETVLSRR